MTHMAQSRRRFLATLTAAGGAGLIGGFNSSAQEAPPETTTIRIAKNSTICIAPQYVADELLRTEGFTDIQYLERPPAVLSAALGRGEVDFSLHLSAPSIVAIDAGDRLAMIAGVHVGCLELFANENVHSIRDLKGRRVGVQAWGGTPHVFLTAMAAYVGLDPAKDIDWVLSPSVAPKELFIDGKIDAFLGTPPEPQELRARKIGRVILNSSIDRPWSQYFCCMLTGSRDFVRKHPVATKRVLRAILKATDFCASDPVGAARRMVDGGFTDRYDYALQTLKDVPYNRWREYDPEDTIRFYSLRLREAGMIKATPNKILADGTDWRFLNELKRELKG
jgi:NitT/TauT family transport system substrate-binding protein